MATKYYRVKQTNFMWDEGAILHHRDGDSGYTAINDLWNHADLKGEFISCRIIEDPANLDFFERVYPIGKLEKMVFGDKKQAQAAAAALYKGGK